MIACTVMTNVIVLTILIRALTLDGAGQGVLFFMTPDFSRLSDPKVSYIKVLPFITINDIQGIVITIG